MLDARKASLRLSAALAVVGVAFLIFPPYAKYCEEDYAKYYPCAAYEIAVALGIFVRDNNPAITAIATLAIAGFTLTLWLSTRDLWRAGERQRAASEITTKRELRAYVGIEHPEIALQGGSFVAFVDYINAGKTPAHDVEVRMCAEVYDFSTIPTWVEPNNPKDEGKGGVLLPSISWRRNASVKGLIDSYAAVVENLSGAKPKQRIWVWGTISYRDIFDERNDVRFRFWSSEFKRVDDKERVSFALIPDIAHTKATYGIKP
jgi:hypothetical protein